MWMMCLFSKKVSVTCQIKDQDLSFLAPQSTVIKWLMNFTCQWCGSSENVDAISWQIIKGSLAIIDSVQLSIWYLQTTTARYLRAPSVQIKVCTLLSNMRGTVWITVNTRPAVVQRYHPTTAWSFPQPSGLKLPQKWLSQISKPACQCAHDNINMSPFIK